MPIQKLNKKNRKNSSNQWILRHINDQYVKKSKKDGYRSRSAYKIIQIHEKFKIFKPGLKVIDLGAAPGGWSQIAAKLTKSSLNNPSVIALDILPMPPIPGVINIKKDFCSDNIFEEIFDIASGKVDIVMSDMSPNTTGQKAIDHLKIIRLCEQAFDFASLILNPKGVFIAKVFAGGTESELLAKIKEKFDKTHHIKPNASRKESKEMYLAALNFKH